MTIVASNDPRIMTVEVTDDLIIAHLADGRTISVPLAWSWRLSNATPEQRQHFEIIGTGQGVHWPDMVHFPEAFQGGWHANGSRHPWPISFFLLQL